MPSVADVSGRVIRFTVDNSNFEFEITSGSVVDEASHDLYLPVGRRIMNVVTHGRSITYSFQGAILINALPWSNYDTTTGYPTNSYLTPGTAVENIYVTLNRGGTYIGTEDEPFEFLEEVYHYSSDGQVISMEHAFDTATHQVFNVRLMADGHYLTPQLEEA